MPIRFRCAYCNQLMGIARRKAGTVVRCPKCAGQVVVPDPEEDDAGSDIPVPEDGGGAEFDVAPVAPRLAPAKKPASTRASSHADDEFDAVPLTGAAGENSGIVLSRLLFAVMILAMLTLVGFAYYMGYVTGKG
jgi:DNA-directed RNA polymerase subunit RPC12/RpoP